MLVFLQQEPQNALLVDVRPVEEFVEGHLPGAVNIPLERVARVLPRLQKYERIIFYCNFGFVSEEAQTLARQSGLQQTRYLKKTVRVNPDGSFEIR
jgi:rhodanese-related sulfurtransferase